MIETKDIYEKLKNEKTTLYSKIAYSHKKKTKNKSIRMSLGRVWFNTLLPDDFPLVDEPVKRNTLNNIIKQIFKKYGPEKSTTIISNIQREAFKMASISPNTFNIDGLIIPDDIMKKKKEFEKKAKNMTPQEYNKASDELAKEFVKYIKSQNLTLHNVLEGGVKGDVLGDWKALLIAKGYLVDIEGEVYGPVVKGTAEGYNGEEYYKAAASARRGFFFKTIAVQNPGYLARKIITANANLKIDDKDCNSKKYLEILVNSKNANLFLGRFHMFKGKLTEIKTTKSLIGKKIKLRSPLYCKSKNGICKTCYGNLYKKLKSNNIGIIAGGAVNQVVVNKMMKMRHKTAQVEVIDVNFIETIKKSKMDIKFLNLFFDIEENKINAKQDCKIIIDKDDYNEKTLLNSSDHYILPGIIDVIIGEGDEIETITFPFNFKVNLNKPKNLVLSGKIITLNYTTGENIIHKKSYTKDEDPSVVEKLFEGGLKFISDPEILLNLMHEELPSIDYVHLELIVSNMFRNVDDLSEPCRLSSYKNFKILGQKQIPFESSWLNALAFENINKAIKSGLISNKDAELNPLEKLFLEHPQ